MSLYGACVLQFSIFHSTPYFWPPPLQAPGGSCICDLCFKTAWWNRSYMVPILFPRQRKNIQLNQHHTVGKRVRIWKQILPTREQALNQYIIFPAILARFPQDSLLFLFMDKKVVLNSSLIAVMHRCLLSYLLASLLTEQVSVKAVSTGVLTLPPFPLS